MTERDLVIVPANGTFDRTANTYSFGHPTMDDVFAFASAYARLEETADARALAWNTATEQGPLNQNMAVWWQVDGNVMDGFTGLVGRYDHGAHHLGVIAIPWFVLTATDEEFDAILTEHKVG